MWYFINNFALLLYFNCCYNFIIFIPLTTYVLILSFNFHCDFVSENIFFCKLCHFILHVFAYYFFYFALLYFCFYFFGIDTGLLFGIDDWWHKNISDVDGLGNSLPGAQQLADYQRLERAVVNGHKTPNIEAGKCIKGFSFSLNTLL